MYYVLLHNHIYMFSFLETSLRMGKSTEEGLPSGPMLWGSNCWRMTVFLASIGHFCHKWFHCTHGGL